MASDDTISTWVVNSVSQPGMAGTRRNSCTGILNGGGCILKAQSLGLTLRNLNKLCQSSLCIHIPMRANQLVTDVCHLPSFDHASELCLPDSTGHCYTP